MELPFFTFRPLESVVVLCAPAGATARSFERSLECRREPVRLRYAWAASRPCLPVRGVFEPGGCGGVCVLGVAVCVE